MKNTLTIGCEVLEHTLVVPLHGYGGRAMADGPYFGPTKFHYVTGFRKEPDLISAAKLPPETIGDSYVKPKIPWVPDLITLFVQNSDSESPFDITRLEPPPGINVHSDLVAVLDAEPDWNDAGWADYEPTYGAGHSYWLEFIVNGSLVASGSYALSASPATETTITGISEFYIFWSAHGETTFLPELVVNLYSASGGTLLDTAETFLRKYR